MLHDLEDEISPLPSPVSLGVSGTKSQKCYDFDDEISPLPPPVYISKVSAAPLGMLLHYLVGLILLF